MTDDTATFLHRQNCALEAFRSRIAQDITITLQRIDRMIKEDGINPKVDGEVLKEWLSGMYKAAKRAYDREMDT